VPTATFSASDDTYLKRSGASYPPTGAVTNNAGGTGLIGGKDFISPNPYINGADFKKME
jgi:hypothetical protein